MHADGRYGCKYALAYEDGDEEESVLPQYVRSRRRLRATATSRRAE
jgi:hypothetical protein